MKSSCFKFNLIYVLLLLLLLLMLLLLMILLLLLQTTTAAATTTAATTAATTTAATTTTATLDCFTLWKLSCYFGYFTCGNVCTCNFHIFFFLKGKTFSHVSIPCVFPHKLLPYPLSVDRCCIFFPLKMESFSSL